MRRRFTFALIDARTIGARSTTHYVAGGGYEVATTSAGTRTAKLYVGASAVVIDTEQLPGQHAIVTNYLSRDHLGSLDVITDQAGVLQERLSFDAWGKRREVHWTAYVAPSGYAWQSKPITRGFTGHEQLDPVGLVHMNGRVYDPELGRFLSADAVIQDVTNLQTINAYSYVLNNPLSLTDPTGFFFQGLFRAIGGAFKAAFRAIRAAFRAVLRSAIGRAILQIIACIPSPVSPATCAGAAAAMTLATGGSVIDAIKSAAFTFVQMGVWSGVGQFVQSVGIASNVIAKGLVHGVVGGALSVAQGGGFVQGFAANAVGAAAGLVSQDAFGPVGSPDGFLQRTAVAAIGGGLAADHAMYFLNRDWQISGFMVLVSMCSTLLPMIERRQCSARRWHGSSSG